MKNNATSLKSNLPQKRSGQPLDSFIAAGENRITKRVVSKTDQNLIMNYFEFVGKVKENFLKLERSTKNVDWNVRNSQRFKDFVRGIKMMIINENLDFNKDYDIRELDKQKIMVNRMMDEFEKWIAEPQVDVMESVSKNWNEVFAQLVSCISKSDNIKKLEVVSKYRAISSTTYK